MLALLVPAVIAIAIGLKLDFFQTLSIVSFAVLTVFAL